MKLKDLIDTLSTLPAAAPVYIAGQPAGHLASYRGYYDQLTITRGETPPTVSELLKDAKAAAGKTFTGYKGGDFRMDLDTTVWGDDYGDAHGTALAGVVLSEGKVHIHVFDASDYQGY